MERMKTFFLYLSCILIFMFVSHVLENGLIENMYKKIDGYIEPSNTRVSIADVNAKASNVNGYMSFRLSNDSTYTADGNYIKIDLYSKRGLLAATKYVKIQDLPSESGKEYQIKFKAKEIYGYKVSIVTEVPDKTNIINILGWEIDLTDVFGMDLSNSRFMGVKLTDLFSWDGAKEAGSNAWSWSLNIMQSVPWWGYAIATGIILWQMPVGFLFGIFPF